MSLGDGAAMVDRDGVRVVLSGAEAPSVDGCDSGLKPTSNPKNSQWQEQRQTQIPCGNDKQERRMTSGDASASADLGSPASDQVVEELHYLR